MRIFVAASCVAFVACVPPPPSSTPGPTVDTRTTSRTASAATSTLSVSPAAEANGSASITATLFAADEEGRPTPGLPFVLEASGAATALSEGKTASDGGARLTVVSTNAGAVTFTATLGGLTLTASGSFVAVDDVQLKVTRTPRAAGWGHAFDVEVATVNAHGAPVTTTSGEVQLSINRTQAPELLGLGLDQNVADLSLTGTTTAMMTSGKATFRVAFSSTYPRRAQDHVQLRAAWNGRNADSNVIITDPFDWVHEGLPGMTDLKIYMDESTDPSTLWLYEGSSHFYRRTASGTEVVKTTYASSTSLLNQLSFTQIRWFTSFGRTIMSPNSATLFEPWPLGFEPLSFQGEDTFTTDVDSLFFDDPMGVSKPYLTGSGVLDSNYGQYVWETDPLRAVTPEFPDNAAMFGLVVYRLPAPTVAPGPSGPTGPAMPRVFVAMNNNGGIHRFEEGTTDWTSWTAPFLNFKRLLVDTSTTPPTVILQRNSAGELWSRRDDAAMWTQIMPPPISSFLPDTLEFDPSTHTLYTLIFNGATSANELWTSTTQGASFTQLTTPIALPDNVRTAFDHRTRKLYIVANDTTLLERDAGGNWTYVNLGFHQAHVEHVSASLQDPNEVCTTLADGRTYASRNGGDTWFELPRVPAMQTFTNVPCAVDANTDPPTYYVAAGPLYALPPNATTWSVDMTITARRIILDDTMTPATIYVNDAFLARRTTDVTTWETAATPTFGYKIALDGRGTKTIYLATPGGIYRHPVNDFVNATPTQLGTAVGTFDLALEVHGADPPIVWASTGSQIYKILDNGMTELVTPPTSSGNVKRVAYSADKSSVYVIASGGLFRRATTDVSWRARATRFNSISSGMVSAGEHVFMNTSQGLARFSDEVVQ